MKMPAPKGIIIVSGNQQLARNIVTCIAPGQKNVNCLQYATEMPPKSVFPELQVDKDTTIAKTEDTKRVPLEDDEGKEVIIGAELEPAEECDLRGVSRDAIEH